jgi:hypothetical protein
MSLTIKELQSIIQSNRQTLSDLYWAKGMCKMDKRIYDAEGDLELEYLTHNNLKEISKQIAKLVSLQKSLKATVRTEVANQRIRTTAAKVNAMLAESGLKKEAMARSGEGW